MVVDASLRFTHAFRGRRHIRCGARGVANAILGTMSHRTAHTLFLSLAVPGLAFCGFWILRATGRWNAPECRALAWATGTVGLHAVLGLGLWKRTSGPRGQGIAGGLSILALRFLSGAGLVVTGIVANPGMEKVFTFTWSAMFLILFASESIFFVQGVQEL
jgi:hypothetical protein